MSVDKIDLNNLDKSEWKTYRFDEIAKNISERVDPNNTDLKVYIGLEHIDSESLHIKRFGTPDDVNGQKLKFYEGDIIFGRRRAYQRKAGIATCDGFCSAHALVLRANPEIIDPELFPFFLHSDLFMDLAVDISVGSLSPTINWGKLKEQTFILPPKYIQGELASILNISEQVLSSQSESLDKCSIVSEALLRDIFSKEERGVSLEELFDVNTGFPYKSKEFNETEVGFKLMRGINIKEGCFLWNHKIDRHYNGDDGLNEKYKVKNLDILVPMDGSKLGYNYAQATNKEEGCLLVQRIASFRCRDKQLRSLLLAFLASRYFRDFVAVNNTTTAIPHVSLKQLKSIRLPHISELIADKLSAYDDMKVVISNMEAVINSKKQLKKSLINQVF